MRAFLSYCPEQQPLGRLALKVTRILRRKTQASSQDSVPTGLGEVSQARVSLSTGWLSHCLAGADTGSRRPFSLWAASPYTEGPWEHQPTNCNCEPCPVTARITVSPNTDTVEWPGNLNESRFRAQRVKYNCGALFTLQGLKNYHTLTS